MKSTPTTEDRAKTAAVRRRYYEAMAAGMAPDVAASVANGRARPEPAPVPVQAPPAPTAPVIPEDLDGMTWQPLRTLAMAVIGPNAKAMKRAEMIAALAAERDRMKEEQ